MKEKGGKKKKKKTCLMVRRGFGWLGYQNTGCYISGGTGPAVDSWVHQRAPSFSNCLAFDNITRRVAVSFSVNALLQSVTHASSTETFERTVQINKKKSPFSISSWVRKFVGLVNLSLLITWVDDIRRWIRRMLSKTCENDLAKSSSSKSFDREMIFPARINCAISIK